MIPAEPNHDPSSAGELELESPHEKLLRDLIEQFADALRRGEAPDPYECVIAHPELAAELEPRLLQVLELYEKARIRTARESVPGAGALALDLPRSVGRYRIDGILGQGGQAIVFRAFDPKFNRSVALKVLHPSLAAAPGYLQRFRQTTKTVAKLRHPNIVELHDAGQDAGFHFVDMFLVDGQSLQKHLELQDGNLLPYRASALLVYKLALALQHAHEQGVVHRDIKPANILLQGAGADDVGEPQLTDFGLARDLDLEATQSRPGAVLGAPAYMAPEQAAGQSHAADARSDVYGLGAVLYELLAGRWPFHDCTTFAALIQRKVHDDPAAVRQLNPAAPPDLETICHKAIERDPTQRFASAQVMAEELWRWLHDESLSIRPTTRRERAHRWARRNQVSASLMGTLGAVLVIAAAVFGWVQVERSVETQVRRRLEEENAGLKDKLLTEFERYVLLNAWQRLKTPTKGRRADALAKLNDLLDRRREEGRPLVDPAVRSLYAAALAVPELREVDAIAFHNDPFLLLPLSMHPDGGEIVVGTSAGPVRWTIGQKLVLSKAQLALKPLPRLCHSPDGKWLAFAPAAGGLCLSASGDVEHCVREQTGIGTVIGLGFERDSKAFWTVDRTGKVVHLSVPELREKASWRAPPGPTGFTVAAVSPDGAAIAIGDAEGRAVLYQSDGKRLGEVPAVGAGVEVEALAWNSDATQIAVGTHDGMVRLRTRAGQLLRDLPLAANGVGQLTFTPDGQWLLAGQRNGPLNVWDVTTGEQVLDGDLVPWNFSTNGRHFAASRVGAVVLAELERSLVAYRLRGHRVNIEKLTWSRDGKHLASLDARGEIRVWDVRQERCIDFLAADTGSFFGSNSAIALSEDASMLAYASGGRPSTLLLRDVGRRRTVQQWKLPAGYDRLACVGGSQFVSVREEEVEPESRRWQGVVRGLDGVAGSLGEPRVLRKHVAGERGFFDAGLSADGRRYFWLGPRSPHGAYRADVFDVVSGDTIFNRRLPMTQPVDNIGAQMSSDGATLWLQHVPEEPAGLRFDLTNGKAPIPARGPALGNTDGRWFVSGVIDPLHQTHVYGLKKAHDEAPWMNLPPNLAMPTLSHDGRHLAMSQQTGPNGSTIVVFDLETLRVEMEKFEQSLSKR